MKNLITYGCAVMLVLMANLTVAGTIVVDRNGVVTSVREAIQRAQAHDTIYIHAGTFQEGNIVIDKPLTIIGIDFPVLDGENKEEIITVRAPHVTITGLHLMNSGVSSMKDLAGIGGEKADYVTISGNKLSNTFFGIHLLTSRYCRIENNELIAAQRQEYNTGNGIHLWQCTNATIAGNIIRHHRDGVYFEFVTHSAIERNISENNLRYGLHFMFSNDDEYRGNVFRNNGSGVAVMYTKRVKMIDNSFEHNWGAASFGLLLKDIGDSRIEGNTFIKNTVGIFMEGTSRTVLEKNTFARNGWGVKLQANCDDNVFERNDFSANTFDITTNGTLVLNTLKYNYWDKYEGYDLNKDGIGDVPFLPASMFSFVVERVPTSVLLWRSFLVFLMDRSEKVMPAVTPENLKDESPVMRPYDYTRERK